MARTDQVSGEAGWSYLSRCKEASDFVLHVGPARLPAHKRVLAGRSPVFAAMFDHQDMAENRTNSLRLSDDDDVEVYRSLLSFMYTGRAEDLERLAEKLIFVAAKYQVLDLQKVCAQNLLDRIQPDNAARYLVVVDLLDIHSFKVKMIEYIQKEHERVVKTSGWKMMIRMHPHLIDELYDSLHRKFSEYRRELMLFFNSALIAYHS